MTLDEHSPFLENIPAYALGALDAGETASLEAHLRVCESCRTELESYRAVSDNLLASIPPRQPTPALRKRLQSRLPGAQKILRPRLAWSFNRLAIGFAFVLLLALNVYSILQMQSLRRQQAQLARELQTSQTALAMLSYPGTETLPINARNVSGTLLVDKDRNVASLIVWDMPQLQADQTYQAWLIDPQGKRTSAGIFRPEQDQPFTSLSILSKNDLSNFVGLGVTVEPAGGSDQPTGQRIFKVDF